MERGEGLFRIDEKYANIKSPIIAALNQLAASKDTATSLQALFRLFNANIDFDLAIIQLLRIVIANYLKLNSNEEINGLSLDTLVSLHKMSLEEFIMLEVLAPYREAKSIILSIAPLVLRMNISLLVFDPSSEIPVLLRVMLGREIRARVQVGDKRV